MYKMVAAVLGFLALVVGVIAFIIVLYTPVEEPIRWEEQGILYFRDQEYGTAEIGLGGTLRYYRFGNREPHFGTNIYSNEEGLLIDGQRILPRLAWTWGEDQDIIRYSFNGVILFTDREFSFVVARCPSAVEGEDIIAVAPAGNSEEAKKILASLLVHPYMDSRWSSDGNILRRLTE